MELNEAQRIMVREIEGPMLVLAGAGAGKTTGIVKRIEAMLDAGIPREEILPITYTNKASKELELRLGNRASAYTFHKLGLLLMRKQIDRSIVPLDEEEREFILENVCRELRHDYSKKNTKIIMNLKRDLGDGYVEKMVVKNKKDAVLQEIAKRYEEYKVEMCLADFDDLIFNLYRIADEGKKWRYVLLDEAQDCSEFEFEILKKLSMDNNITVVGDTSQSIYRFKGGRSENLMKFKMEFDPLVVRMDINYRSAQRIVRGANNLIVKNSDPLFLKMKAHREDPGTIRVVDTADPVESMREIIRRAGHDDFYILCREWADVDHYYERLKNTIPLARNAPVDVAAESHDLFNLFTLYENPTNEYMLYWYLGYFMDRRILEKIRGKVRITYSTNKGLPPKYRRGLREAVDRVRDCPRNKKDIFQLLPSVKNRDVARLIFHYMDEPTLESYHAAVYLAQQEINDKFGGVIVTTAHQVKGLERRCVIIADAVQDKFPTWLRSGEDPVQHMKQERNLFYVAVTRAKEGLYIVVPEMTRTNFGTKRSVESLFIDEMRA